MDVSQITPYLYVGTQPTEKNHYDFLRFILGISLIINTRAESPPKLVRIPSCDSPTLPIPTLHVPTRDRWPIPIPTPSLFLGVEQALFFIHGNGRVFVHCAAGRHRSVAMAAAILIAMGRTAEEAMDSLEKGRSRAHPRAWHIQRSIRKFEKVWHKKNST